MSFTTSRQDVHQLALAVGLLYLAEFLLVTALILRLHGQGASSATIAALMLATAVPMVLASPLAGVLVDRVDSRLLLGLAGVGQTVTCAALAWVDAPAAVLVGVAVLAVAFSVVSPVLNALVPAMVDAAHLPRANSLVASAITLGLVLGPALGGLLTGEYGTRVPVMIAAALYALACLAAVLLRTRRRRVRSDSRDGRGFADGIRLLRADPAMLGMLVLASVVALLLQVTNVAEVFLVRDTLRASATMFGLIGGAWMVGMFAGAWLVGLAAKTDGGLLRWGLSAAALQAFALAAVAFVPDASWLIVLFVFGGVGNGAMNVARQTVIGRRAPAPARGRVFSVVTAVSNIGSVVALGVGGAVVGLADPRLVYGICGALCTAAVLGYATSLLRVARALDGRAAPQPMVAAGPR
jgi:MFS family permease